MMRNLQSMGFRFKLVLADSLYGEYGFIDVLYELKLDFVVAIQIAMQSGYPLNKRFASRWRKFDRF